MDALNTFFESGAFFILFVSVVAILLLREIRCWYWKINDRVTIQNQQVNLLVEIAENQEKIIALLEKALTKKNDPE